MQCCGWFLATRNFPRAPRQPSRLERPGGAVGTAEPNMKTLLDIVSHQPFFAELTESQVGMLTENARYRRFKSGEYVFHDGNLANRIFMVVAGKIALETPGQDGQFVRLQTVGVGEILGWPSPLPHSVRCLRARALEATEVIYYCGDRFRQLCDQDHDLGYHLSQRLAEVTMRRLQRARGLLARQPALVEAADWRPGERA